MNSKILSYLRNKLKKELKDKEILDIVVFGSVVKGKEKPNDIDIAIISNEDISINNHSIHTSLIKPQDFFINPPAIINTLFREGYSLKNEKPFSQLYNFSNKVLFKYELSSLNLSRKVTAVNVLRGKNKEEGLVKSNKGEWLANQVFFAPVENEHIFQEFFKNFKINFKKFYVLIH